MAVVGQVNHGEPAPAGTQQSCQCQMCRAGCERKPGWFMPGEVDRLAAAMGKTPQELFKESLALDFVGNYGDDKRTVFLLSPATDTVDPGRIWGWNAHGMCRWYIDGRCAVHELGKPYECRNMWHGRPGTQDDWKRDHLAVADSWADHQDEIERIAGFKPSLTEPTAADVFRLLFSALRNRWRGR